MTTGFAMTLLASGAIVGALRWREPQRLLVAGLLIVVMGVTFGVLSAPTLNFYRAYGTNEQAARRLVTDWSRPDILSLSGSAVEPRDGAREHDVGVLRIRGH